MIFSNHWLMNFSKFLGGNWIAVYSGTQPSIADYVANYESLYSFNGSELLQVITCSDTGGALGYGTSDIQTDPDGQGYTQGLYSVRAGEGTWATIRRSENRNYREEFEGYYTLSESTVQDLFLTDYTNNTIIVPISDLTGTGVIKFYSTLFSHPDSDQEDRALDLYMKVSLK